MPIYEFYCPHCHRLFNFFSRTINTSKLPACPQCKRSEMRREVSVFAAPRKGDAKPGDDAESGDLPFDESRMESAITALADEAESIGDDDPRQAARLMRKFSKMTGMEFNESIETALNRMEAGEDPERIEEEMGGDMEDGDPFVMPGAKGGKGAAARPPSRDTTLYDL